MGMPALSVTRPVSAVSAGAGTAAWGTRAIVGAVVFVRSLMATGTKALAVCR